MKLAVAYSRQFCDDEYTTNIAKSVFSEYFGAPNQDITGGSIYVRELNNFPVRMVCHKDYVEPLKILYDRICHFVQQIPEIKLDHDSLIADIHMYLDTTFILEHTESDVAIYTITDDSIKKVSRELLSFRLQA